MALDQMVNNIIFKWCNYEIEKYNMETVVMSLMASPLCISCDDDDEVTVNSKFYLFYESFSGRFLWSIVVSDFER